MRLLDMDLSEAIELAEHWLKTSVPSRQEIEIHQAEQHWWPANSIRHDFCRQVSFAIPCSQALTQIAHHSPRLIEVGAGTGYWTALLAQQDVDIIATDSHTNGYGLRIGHYFDVQQADAANAIEQYPDRDVFMCWPSYDEEWTTRAVAAIRKSGRLLHLISEGHGGCCGHEDMFNLLDAHFDPIVRVFLPQWPGIHDDLVIYRRK
jgi:hypothetical protein